MRTSREGLLELIGHEGIALSKYYDVVGVATIGVGATVSEIPDLPSWPLSKTITLEEAFSLFARSVSKYENAINRALKVAVPQHVFDALVSWCYNVGVGWPPKASIIKLINQKTSDKKRLFDALMMFSKPRAIIERRRKEALLLTQGTYSNNQKAQLFVVEKGKPSYKKSKIIDLSSLHF